MGPVDHRLTDLLWELDDIVRRRGDIRDRVFGFVPDSIAEDDSLA
jgi:hypothetical protein